jgi:hypothetical protein
MGNVWENRLSKEEYQVLDKAFEDYCKTINITKKDFFLKINEQTRTEGWNVIVQKLPSDLIETIKSIMDVSKKPASQTAIAFTENLPTTATNKIMTSAATTTNMPLTANAATMMKVATTTNVVMAATTRVAMMAHAARSTNVGTMIPLLNPTNDIMFAGLFGLNNKEKAKFRRDQAKYLRKEKNLLVIQGKNKDHLTGKATCRSYRPHPRESRLLCLVMICAQLSIYKTMSRSLQTPRPTRTEHMDTATS